jgi:hypothetical protein
MISVCVPFYPWIRNHDRSEEVFDVLVRGLNKTSHAKSLELCLTDGGAEDIYTRNENKIRHWDHEKFYERLKKEFKGKLNYKFDPKCVHKENGNRRFWLARAVAQSVKRASYENILIFGIDCHAPRDLAQRFSETVQEGISWVIFPFNVPQGAPLAINEPGGKGYCWHTARGIVGIKKSDYKKVGGYEKSLSLISNRTDSNFFNRMVERLKVIKRREPGFFHVNHFGSNASKFWRLEDAQCG